MAQIIAFPTGLVAAANFAARSETADQPGHAPVLDGSNVVRLPQCQSVGTLEDQLERMRERLAAELGDMRTARVTLHRRTIEGRLDQTGHHWIA
jgi:hypothetical protein